MVKNNIPLVYKIMNQNYQQNMRQNTKPVLNAKLQNAVNHLSGQHPIDSLSVEEIINIQVYLDKIKENKLGQQQNQMKQSLNRATDVYDPVQRDLPEPGSRGAVATRLGKRSTNDYYNPYEYGAKQNQLGKIDRERYDGSCQSDPDILDRMGLAQNLYNEKFPGEVRNVNVESYLLQKEATNLPGKREITQKDYNRFTPLPFNPQDPAHIVWDDMPRGGYATRSDRLEY